MTDHNSKNSAKNPKNRLKNLPGDPDKALELLSRNDLDNRTNIAKMLRGIKELCNTEPEDLERQVLTQDVAVLSVTIKRMSERMLEPDYEQDQKYEDHYMRLIAARNKALKRLSETAEATPPTPDIDERKSRTHIDSYAVMISELDNVDSNESEDTQ